MLAQASLHSGSSLHFPQLMAARSMRYDNTIIRLARVHIQTRKRVSDSAIAQPMAAFSFLNIARIS
jgi:hypothetical protein